MYYPNTLNVPQTGFYFASTEIEVRKRGNVSKIHLFLLAVRSLQFGCCSASDHIVLFPVSSKLNRKWKLACDRKWKYFHFLSHARSKFYTKNKRKDIPILTFKLRTLSRQSLTTMSIWNINHQSSEIIRCNAKNTFIEVYIFHQMFKLN